MVDIHSHILPNIDDGAQTPEESLQLLYQLKEHGITDVFATPHFYPMVDNANNFKMLVKNSYEEILELTKNENLPNIHLGCELLYFENIGSSNSLSQFCLGNSKYLLLELANNVIGNKLFCDLINLKEQNIIPIIAHIERYYGCKNYRKLLKFIEEENILTQINASSVVEKYSYRAVKKLIKKGLVTFIGTDAHSVIDRKPLMSEALKRLQNDFGEEYVKNLIQNNDGLLEDITDNQVLKTFKVEK